MAQKLSKIPQFWQELKRRRVFHVIMVYASVAWLLIQLVNNLLLPLNLPTIVSTIVIIALAVGFPFAIILAWMYELTPEGFEETKAEDEEEVSEAGILEGEEETTEKVKVVVPLSWRIATYASFVLIVGLLTINLAGRSKHLRPGDIQSLLILPFDNFTGDDQLDYVAAGMHTALIGDMGKISALRVISKTTASAYKTKDMSLPQIAKEINMGAVIEPSVMCYGDSVCIQIRVITMYPEEKQLWVAEYTEEKSQILNLYNRLTKEIANDLMVELTPGEELLLARSVSIDKEAYDSYLKGLYFLEDLDLESLNKAREYLTSAIEKNPDWAPLYSGLATVWISLAQMGFESPELAGPNIFENLNKALELDPDNAASLFVIGMSAFLNQWEWEKAEMAFLKALSTNPSDAMSRVLYAHLLACLQRPDESMIQGRMAIELDPLNSALQVLYGAVLSGTGDFETALAYGEKTTAEDPGNFMANNLIEVAAFSCGDYKKVMEAAKYVLPAKGVEFKAVDRIFQESGFVAAYEENLRQLETLAQKGYSAPVEMAYRYMMVDKADKAMDWLERGFVAHDPVMPYIATKMFLFEPLFDNPRFIDILQKMNLPLPNN